MPQVHRSYLAWIIAAVLVALGLNWPGSRSMAAAPALQSGCDAHVASVEQLVETHRSVALETGEGGELPADDIITMLRVCWQELAQQMPAAEKNCSLYKQLASRVTGWSRQVSLLSLDGEFAAEQAEVMPWLMRSLVNCFDEAFTTCVDQHDPEQVFEMRAIERQLALIGAENVVDASKYEKCLRFEVSFESVLEFMGSASFNNDLRAHLRATAPVRGAADFSLTGGEGRLEYQSFTAVQRLSDRCSPLPVNFQATAPFRVDSIRFERPERQEGLPMPAASDITLALDPGMTRETYGASCPPARVNCPTMVDEFVTVSCPSPGNVMSEGSHYRLLFEFFHAGERQGSIYTVRGWTLSKGPVIARKTFERSAPWADGLVTRTEKTTLELRHTPVR